MDKQAVVRAAMDCGFADVGFTSAAPFDSQREILAERQADYAWAQQLGLDLVAGTDPQTILPGARAIVVLMELYFKAAFPLALEAHFGRCYLEDDRVTRDGLSRRVKAFRGTLRDHGVDSKVPFNLPHRLAAARAGMGTFGKNCLFYSSRVARRSSWVLPIAVVVDAAFEPDAATLVEDCPAHCKSACLAACPTGALRGPRRIDPRRCISFLTYYGEDLPPADVRAAMGLWVYGCDRCQNVCPRNAPWLAKQLPVNRRVAAMAADFDLRRLLHMDRAYFSAKIWPHMFYTGPDDLWRWTANVARAMGNSRDREYVPDLVQAFGRNTDERVLGMIAWSLGRLGGPEARQALERWLPAAAGRVRAELIDALKTLEPEIEKE